MCCADLVTDTHRLNGIGWSMIATLVLNFAVNLGSVSITTAKTVYFKLKVKWYTRKLRLLKANQEKELTAKRLSD